MIKKKKKEQVATRNKHRQERENKNPHVTQPNFFFHIRTDSKDKILSYQKDLKTKVSKY